MRMAMIIVASLSRDCQHLIRKNVFSHCNPIFQAPSHFSPAVNCLFDEMSCPCPLFDPSRKATKPTRPPTTTKSTTLSNAQKAACVS